MLNAINKTLNFNNEEMYCLCLQYVFFTLNFKSALRKCQLQKKIKKKILLTIFFLFFLENKMLTIKGNYFVVVGLIDFFKCILKVIF